MLELERREPAALVAAVADEARDRADVRSAAGERFGLRAGVEIVALDADGRHRLQPPVIGGKNATSFAPAIEASAAGVNAVEGGANRERLGEGVRVALAPFGEPGDEVADGRHGRWRIELLLRLADPLAHPGEIKRFHARLSRRRHGRSSPSYSPSRCRA